MSYRINDYHDDDEDDGDYEILGTPFPALESDEIVSSKVEIDQTVRDERGRRRFHGAFTGGFSAGFWNTVGSAEGFTPKIFKSSRKDKFDSNEFKSKPEDFMDEEDFGAFGIAPKKIFTQNDFVENFTHPGEIRHFIVFRIVFTNLVFDILSFQTIKIQNYHLMK